MYFFCYSEELLTFQICNTFDNLAKEFRQENPRFDDLTTRRKALCLVRWLREEN